MTLVISNLSLLWILFALGSIGIVFISRKSLLHP